MTEHVIVTDDGGIRTIRINRPEKKNALTIAMYEAMIAALDSANISDAVRCVLIAGVPGAFTAGNDLADFLAVATGDGGFNRAAVMTVAAQKLVWLRFLPALVGCNKPMVAAVTGVAVGIGTTMLLHCDFVIAGTDAFFSNSIRRRGPGAGSGLDSAGAAPDGPSPCVRVSGHGPPAQRDPRQGLRHCQPRGGSAGRRRRGAQGRARNRGAAARVGRSGARGRQASGYFVLVYRI